VTPEFRAWHKASAISLPSKAARKGGAIVFNLLSEQHAEELKKKDAVIQEAKSLLSEDLLILKGLRLDNEISDDSQG